LDIHEEQFRELLEESAQLGRASREIDADVFKEMAHASVTAAGGAGAAKPAVADKRAAARIGVRYTVTVRPIISHINLAATPFSAVVVDVSRDGVGLICPVAIHDKFTLEMPNQHGIIFAVTCTKRSARKLAEHRYAVGGTFDDPLEQPRPAAASPEDAATKVNLKDTLPPHPALAPFDLLKHL
jgi:hypothetical protein